MINDAIDALLDENSNDNIIIYDDADDPKEYEQIAIIPLLDKSFAILHEVGTDDDEADVFYVAEDRLILVSNESIVMTLFEKYYALCDGKNLEDKYLLDEALDNILEGIKELEKLEKAE